MFIKQRKALPKERSNVSLAPLTAYVNYPAAWRRKTEPGSYLR